MTWLPILDITIPGEPTAKGRGRAVRAGNRVRIVTPGPTRTYEATVAQVAAMARADSVWPVAGPLKVHISAVHRRPGNLFRVKDGWYRQPRARRPDIDNVVKAVLDGLNAAGIWQDDAQVTWLEATQWDGEVINRKAKTSEPPHVRVEMWRWADVDPHCPGCMEPESVCGCGR